MDSPQMNTDKLDFVDGRENVDNGWAGVAAYSYSTFINIYITSARWYARDRILRYHFNI
jgi:hypothetical protein